MRCSGQLRGFAFHLTQHVRRNRGRRRRPVGVEAYSLYPNTGTFTPVPNGFTAITDTEVGDPNRLAITK